MNRVFGFIDLQKDFMNEDGKLYVHNATSIKKNIKKLVNFAVDNDCSIFFTQDQHDGTEPEFETFPLHCMISTPGAELIPECNTESKKAINFPKRCYDVFNNKLGNPDIDKWLKEENITEVWLAGVVGNICVEAAADGLRKRNIDVYIFENVSVWMDLEKGIFCEGNDNKEKSIDRLRKIGCHFVKCKL